MRVTVSNDIAIENPAPAITNFCNTELKIPNPIYYKKLQMGKWIGNTPTLLYLYSKDGNTLHLPSGTWERIKPLIPNGTYIETDLANKSKIDYRDSQGNKSKVPLYDYQEQAVFEMLTHNYGILQAPCGSGKTQVGIDIAVTLEKKTLWLTHTKDLLSQSYDRAAQYIDKKFLGTITEGKVNISDGITFATVQTMEKLDLPQYRHTWDLVIVDECHRVTGTPTALTMFSKVLNNLAAYRKYGLSATVYRGDGMIKGTLAIMGNVTATVPECAVADSTMEVTVQEIRTGVELSTVVQNTDGTLNYPKLVKYIVENQERSKFIASKLTENRKNSNLIMSDRLQHLKDIIEHLKALGIPEEEIRMIDGSMTSKKGKTQRKQALVDMKSGEAKYLFASYSLAKEGLNIPNLNRLFMAFPKKDFAIVTQSIGRISRTSPGKTDAICYDFVDEIGYCVHSWEKRKAIYKKKGCEIIEVPTPKKEKPDKLILKTLELTKF
jgi:superfamily II DNA or RNA helicase